jgi:hypothetical protein
MTPTRRRLVFTLCAIAVSAIVTTAVLLGVDIYLHGRYQQSAGFNVWGYRGTPVGRKEHDEYRIVMLGGSAAYGYGVTAEDAIPAVLQRLLRQYVPSPRFTVVNLAYNNEGAYSFKPTLQDYRWLDYDLVILYEGYNDMGERSNLQVFRHDSPVFRLTGYLPIFPIIFKEKAAAMASGGDAGAYYRHDGRTVFHAGLATRAGAGVLDATANVAEALETQLGRISAEPVHRVDGAGSNCASPWAAYCQSMAAAIRYAREQGAQVLVATQPYLRGPVLYPRHFAQQNELRAMLQREFGSDRSVAYVNLGDRVDVQNPHMSFDRMHLTRAGNREAAAAFFDPVLTLAARKGSKAP